MCAAIQLWCHQGLVDIDQVSDMKFQRCSLHCTYSQVLSTMECSRSVCQRYPNLPWFGHEYVYQVLCWDVLLKTLNVILSWYHGRLLKFRSFSLPFFSRFICLDLSFPLFPFAFLFVVFYVLPLDFPLFLPPYPTFQLSLCFCFLFENYNLQKCMLGWFLQVFV